MREIVLYIPLGGHPATADIVRGSAIVGEPQAETHEVTIYFEGAIFGQANIHSLADRATHAAGRMLEGYPTTAMRVVPRDALVAVGSFDLREGRISLTGPDSERAVAAWLGGARLDPAELIVGTGPGSDVQARRQASAAARPIGFAWQSRVS